MTRLQFFAGPAEFLAVAGDYLAADPVVNTVITTATRRAEGVELSERDWWVVVTDEAGAVAGAGMRTATVGNYPPFLLPMPGAAAVALARAWHERGEEVPGVNGALPAVEL